MEQGQLLFATDQHSSGVVMINVPCVLITLLSYTLVRAETLLRAGFASDAKRHVAARIVRRGKGREYRVRSARRDVGPQPDLCAVPANPSRRRPKLGRLRGAGALEPSSERPDRAHAIHPRRRTDPAYRVAGRMGAGDRLRPRPHVGPSRCTSRSTCRRSSWSALP